jgi:2-haloacid dehalogenase
MAGQALPDVSACVFDAYGTLLDVTSAAKRGIGDLGSRADALAALWRAKQLEYSWLRSLMGRHADFWQVTGDALDYAMETLGLPDAALRARLMELYRELDAYPDAKATLQRLKHAGMPAAILSNGTPQMLQAAILSAGIGDLVDHVISVEEIGIYKPHPSVYALAAKRLGLDPARICFVSSNGWDAAGASASGFKVAWINRSCAKPERLSAPPHAEIGNLSQLPALLGL